jgi:(4-alkanoyl-5-oxo-2,5-dihydrofuran-3-yl)methyl phosphate reductase
MEQTECSLSLLVRKRALTSALWPSQRKKRESATSSSSAQWAATAKPEMPSVDAIRDSGIPWTVVRPGRFMSNALHWRESIRRQGKVFSNYGDGKLPSVHPRDIAAVAVRALTSEDYFGKALEVTGPVALSIAEEVAILSNALGMPIEYVSITDQAARQDMERANMPAYIIDGLLPFAEFVRSGKAARVFPTVEEVTGRPALTFADWAREHAPAFQ